MYEEYMIRMLREKRMNIRLRKKEGMRDGREGRRKGGRKQR